MNRAQKRYNGVETLLNELSDCVSSNTTVEAQYEFKELVAVIDRWLGTLSQDDRVLFLRRYWFGEGVTVLAYECQTTPNKLSGRLFRLRQSLKAMLEKEGISL